MSSNTARTTQSVALLKGINFGKVRLQGEGEISVGHLADTNGFLILIGDSVAAVSAPHLIRDHLEHNLEPLGDGRHRLTLDMARVAILLDEETLALLTAQFQGGKTLDAPFQPAATQAEQAPVQTAKQGGKRPAKTTEAKSAGTKSTAGKQAKTGSRATTGTTAEAPAETAAVAKPGKTAKSGGKQAGTVASGKTTQATGRGRGKGASATTNARTPANDAGAPSRSRNAARSTRTDERLDMPTLFSGTDALTEQPAKAPANAGKASRAKGGAKASASKGATKGSATAAKGSAKTAKAQTGKGQTGKAQSPKAQSAGAAEAVETKSAEPAKGRKGAAKAAQGSAAPVTRPRASRKPPLAQAAPGAKPNSVSQVKTAVVRILEEAGGPLQRRDLYNRLVETGIVVSGRDPVENLATMLYKDPEHTFVKDKAGFRLRDQAAA